MRDNPLLYFLYSVMIRIPTFSTGASGWWICSCECFCRASDSSSRRRRETRTGVAAVSIQPTGGKLDKAWLIRADVGVDPGLVTGHSGVDSWQTRPSTAITKTDNTRLDPDGALLTHHWTSRVSLRGRTGRCVNIRDSRSHLSQGEKWNKAAHLTWVFASCQNTSTDHVVCDCAHTIQTVTLSVSHNWYLHFL